MLKRNELTSTPPDLEPVETRHARLGVMRTALPSAPIPKPLSLIFGRERELARLADLLGSDQERLITLIGPGGVGKTRLALQAADAVSPAFSSVYFVGLSSVADPGQVIPTIAQTLGLRESPDPAHLRLAIHLAGRHSLLVLDNLEHLAEAGSDIASLLSACPTVTVLATSRELLRIRGERVVIVPPLDHLPTGNADESIPPAIRLFVDRATAVRPEFALSPDNLGVIADICQRLDGLPLAIELAASRANHLTPEGLLHRLDRRLPLLVGGSRDLPDRLKTMRNAIAWSYDLLSPDEQIVFRRLAVFPGGFRLDAAESVITETTEGTGHPLKGDSVIDALGSLVEKSLIRFDLNAFGGPRYRFLETVREYALEQLSANGEEVLTKTAFATWCVAFAEANEVFYNIPIRQEHLDLLDSEWPNLQSALTWSESSDEPLAGLRLGAALGLFWYLRGYVQVGWDHLNRALPHLNDAPALLQGRALTALAHLTTVRDDLDAADRFARASLAALNQVSDSGTTHGALLIAGYVAIQRGEHEQAEALLLEAASQVPRIDNPLQRRTAEADCLTNLGDLSHATGNSQRALEQQEQALAIYREVDDTWGMVDTLYHLGGITRDLADHEQSLAWYRECLQVAWDYGDRRAIAAALSGVAGVAAIRGLAEVAAQLIGAADSVLVQAGMSTLPPSDNAGLALAEQSARATLGDERFNAARAEGRSLPVNVVPDLIESLTRQDDLRKPSEIAHALGLTTREIEVLHLLVAGYTDREIGETIYISTRTVESHVSRIAAKLGVRGRTAAVSQAVKLGIVVRPGSSTQ